MGKARVATVWLDGCSGCHMSFLDIDERLLDLAEKIELVYSPLVDAKEFPDEVDVTLVEGSVSSQGDLDKIKKVRAHTKVLVAMGDCAVTANVPGMRNGIGAEPCRRRAYFELAQNNPGYPDVQVPVLLEPVRPVHEVVKVDVFVPGCPPSADTLFTVVSDLLEGKTPEPAHQTRFGA